MKEIIVSIDKFNFNKFVERSIEFAEEIVSPGYAIACIENPGDMPEYEINYENKDELIRLINNGKSLFFMFSSNNIGEPINCANGEEYDIENSDICLGEADCVGFLIQKKEEVFVINSAINAGGGCPAPAPSVDIEIDCDIFDKPMEEFIKKFVK